MVIMRAVDSCHTSPPGTCCGGYPKLPWGQPGSFKRTGWHGQAHRISRITPESLAFPIGYGHWVENIGNWWVVKQEVIFKWGSWDVGLPPGRTEKKWNQEGRAIAWFTVAKKNKNTHHKFNSYKLWPWEPTRHLTLRVLGTGLVDL